MSQPIAFPIRLETLPTPGPDTDDTHPLPAPKAKDEQCIGFDPPQRTLGWFLEACWPIIKLVVTSFRSLALPHAHRWRNNVVHGATVSLPYQFLLFLEGGNEMSTVKISSCIFRCKI